MKAKLSYLYIGERFPELSGQEVVVKELAEKANLSYNLLKNRMGIKKRRSENNSSVWISDVDLEPKKKDVKPKKKISLTDEEKIQYISDKYLRRQLL
jgi:hypothetical protein